MSANLRTDVAPGTWQYWQQNYYQSGSTVNPNNKFSVKLDHDLNTKHRFSFYFGYNKKESVPGPDGAPGIPGNPQRISGRYHAIQCLSWKLGLYGHAARA